MRKGIALTIGFALFSGAVLHADNVGSGAPTPVLVAMLVLAPVVGFLVGRWWVLLALAGTVIGHCIGWDASENDGNPALWAPYLISFVLIIGGPLMLGAAVATARRDRRRGEV